MKTRSCLHRKHDAMRSFLSLLISFALLSLGDIVNLAIANNISFAAIGVMGAYFTVNWVAKELTNFGVYTYRVERKDEWGYLQIALVAGLLVGGAVSALSGVLPALFGIDDAQKTSLSAMLALFVIALPCKSLAIASYEMCRLRGELSAYRVMIVGFYLISIPVNIAMFMLFRDVVLILVADICGNLFAFSFFAMHLRRACSVRFALVCKENFARALRYGAPLVGERMVQRCGLAVYGICASHLPPEMFAVHTVCLNAVYTADIGDSAYSAALMVLVPDNSKEKGSRKRYVSERARMVAYKRKTAAVAIFFSFLASYVAAMATKGDVGVFDVLWFTFFYAFSFIPMCVSTPGKDFLTIQKQPVKVMFATMCGVPFYVIFPLAALFVAPEPFALYLFGLTGTAQILVRALLYTFYIKKMDTEHGISTKEIRRLARTVDIDKVPKELGQDVAEDADADEPQPAF